MKHNILSQYLILKQPLVFTLLINFIGTFPIGYAQDRGSQFIINGSINADTGLIELITLSDSSYYPNRIYGTAHVKNGKFTLMGSVPYPQGAKAKYNGNIVSGLFLVDKGTQSLKLDINQFRKTPFIDNEVMKEYYEDYTTAFKAYKIKLDKFYNDWDSLLKVHDRKLPKDIEFTFRAKQNRYYRQSDSLLTRFIVTHPASYLGLWKLVEIASFSGYESIYDTAFTNLADALKNTHTGQQLSKKLISGRTLVPGKQFPTMHCLNEDNVPLTISSKNQYTLIDFWYSNCSPCISQFPNFNSLYKQFHTAGFEIIGISTDKKKYEINWKKAIIKHNLVWPQYWDVDGEEALKHSINAFPTNFLLNAQRQVIRKNISPVELEQFLIDNLK